MAETNTTLELRPALFWDADMRTLDPHKHQAQVIERFVSRGSKEEFDQVLRFYGWETVKSVVLGLRHLDKYTLSFCAVIFNEPKEHFRCYKLAQSSPAHWDY